MTERVTLELPDEMVRRAREAAQRMEQPLEAILTEWLERASTAEDIFPLNQDTTYHIYTPFGAQATAESLLKLLQTAEDADNPADHG